MTPEPQCRSTCWDKLAGVNTRCVEPMGHTGHHLDGAMSWCNQERDEMVARAAAWLKEAERAGLIAEGQANNADIEARESLADMLLNVTGQARHDAVEQCVEVLRKQVRDPQ